MQDIAEKLKSLSSQAGEGIGKGLDVLKSKALEAGAGLGKGLDSLKSKSSEVGDYLQANPTLAAMLLAGGGAGLLGGYLTSRQPEEEGESKASRRLRILRNALLAGGAGAGAVGLGSAGLKQLSEAVPAGTKNPVQEKLTSPAARALGGIGGGILGFRSGNAQDLEALAEQARSFLNPSAQIRAKGMSPSEVIAFAESKGFMPNSSGFLNFNTRSGNLNRFLRILLGSSRAGQLARAGGAAGVLLPEMISGAKDLVLEGS